MRALLVLLRRAGTEGLELWLALATAVWGLYLLMPWVEFPSSLGMFQPEPGHQFVSLLAIGLGLAKGYLLVRADAAARWAVLIGAMFWLFITVIYAYDNVNTAPAIYGSLTLGNVWAYLRRTGVLR
jgi:hypothetical protein